MLLEDIRKRYRTRPKVGLEDQKRQQEQKRISSVTSSKLHSTTEQMSWKLCQHQLWEDSVKLAYIAELLSKKHCWGCKTMSKGFSGPICTKTAQLVSGIKSFELKNQSSKSLDQIGESMSSEVLVKELKPPYHTNRKVWGRLYHGMCVEWV